jgi:hypothetical protein
MWFFIVFNGLEGLWTIILYIIIRLQHMDDQKRVIAAKQPKKSTSRTYNKSSTYNSENDTDIVTKATGIYYLSIYRRSSQLFDD